MSTEKTQKKMMTILGNTPLAKRDYERFKRDCFKHYIIFENKIKMGYCTACNSRIHRDKQYEHNATGKCPRCHREITYKAKGKLSLWEEQYIINFHRKSEKKIIAITRRFERGYKKDMWGDIVSGASNVSVFYEPYAVYVFEKDKPVKEYRMAYYQLWWTENNKVSADGFYSSSAIVRLDEKKLAEVIDKSWLRYPGEIIKKFGDCDIACLRVIDLVNTHPHLEKLEKVGMGHIIEHKIWGRSVSRSINWKGQTLLQILKLQNKGELRIFLNSDRNIKNLKLIQMARKEKWYITKTEMDIYAPLFDADVDIENCKKIGLKRFLKYKRRQIRGTLANWQFHSYYRDYLRQAKALGYDMEKDGILFPKDIEAAHDRVSEEYRQMKDAEAMENRKEESKKVACIAKENSYLSRITKELEIRPVQSLEELIKEGRELNHCVASYSGKIIENRGHIWVVRKKENPEEAFFTVETNTKGKLLQLRGKHNCNPPEDIKRFVENWSEEIQKKIKQKGNKNGRKKITSANMQHMQMG